MNEAKGLSRLGRLGLLGAMAMVLSLLLAACAGASASPKDKESNYAALASLLGGLDTAQVEAFARGASSTYYPGHVPTNGIQATGVGVVAITPDIAVMSLGVETLADTVTKARDEAAAAIDGMIAALAEAGVDEDDIETAYFNIQPQYTYHEVTETLDNGERIRRTEQRLIGYRVTNTLEVTVRDLDNIGTIIDSAVNAGGDATRLNGISFTLDDGSEAEEQARILALEDAVRKADLYAERTGVERGKLVAIVESSGSHYPVTMRGEEMFETDGASAAPPTQIRAGDVEVRVTVQAVFGIN